MPRVKIRRSSRETKTERVRIGIVAVAALLAATAITVVDLGADASVVPEFGSWINPGSSDALTGMAEDSVSSDLSVAKTYALRAVTIDPLDDRALLVIALAAISTNQVSVADNVFGLVAKLTNRQPLAETWMFDVAVNHGDYAGAIDHADAALRRQLGAEGEVMPVLIGVTDTPVALPALARKLVASPPWRTAFFQAFARSKDGNAAALFRAMRTAGGGATRLEIAAMATQQISADSIQGARAIWQEGFGKPLPALISPDFETSEQYGDFDWDIPAHGGGQIVSRGDGKGRALQVLPSTTGKKPVRAAQVGMYLDSGQYTLRFEGRSLGDNHSIATVAVRCAGTNEELGRSPVPAESAWHEVTIRFSIPSTLCPIQKLVIEADPNLTAGGSPMLVDSFKVE